MKKVILVFALLIFGSTAWAVPIQYEIVDVYSSISVSYDLGGGSSDSIYQETHGASSTTLTDF